MELSLIIPVYNRPDEVDELLESLTKQDYTDSYEVVIVEDGSTIDCKSVIEKYSGLNISYFYKPNSGPGDSRNFGMRNAKGDYFIILDSDCILPSDYLSQVKKSLENDYVDCFGGVDDATQNFSEIQKAINFAMTSLITTGGIRGASETLAKFQPRSFNMGISQKAFEASGGFGNVHPGEDPDLAIRLWDLGFETRLFKNVKVFHKRRISWDKFKIQVHKFGKARVILNHWHPKYIKLTFFFPGLFLIGFLFSIFLILFDFFFFISLYVLYFLICFVLSTLQSKSLKIGLLSVYAVMIQFYGYGTGFIKAFYKINILRQPPEKALPEMFFKL
ncbi:MAG: glycosyltransferase [Flavobacteriaceae bacterium]